jgi:hypothetical protein
VVVDVFFEEDKHGSRRTRRGGVYFWKQVAKGLTSTSPDPPLRGGVRPAETPAAAGARRPADGLRLRSPKLADKLVLSDERKALVRLLIECEAGGFRDIVKGKGGGAVVLLAGPPGTGKTLTAEVYAEAESGPCIRCSAASWGPTRRPGRRTAEGVRPGGAGTR